MLGDGKVAAVGPTSAMICCAESTPRPGHCGQSLHRLLVGRSRPRHLLIEGLDLSFDQAQFVERQLSSRRYTGLRSVQAPSASHNWSGVARRR